MSDESTDGVVIVDDGPREWTREQHEAMEARLARLESFVARWACIVGVPGTEFTRTAEALVASGFDPRGGV